MQNVGGVQYTVEANTAQLLKAEQETNKSVDKMSKSIQRMGESSTHVDKVTGSIKDMGKEAETSGKSLSKIQVALLSLATITTATSLGKMADDYRAMGERVRGATDSFEEYEMVQTRLLESANKTFRPLAEAQELFIATSGNLQDYNYSMEESLNIMDSMSYGFVRNAASTDKAATAIRNYDAILSTGKVNQNQWLAISSAIDTLAIDMGKSMGLTAREVDELGFSGKLTAQELNDGLLAAFEANKAGSGAMANTIEDATTAMKNNISVFVGELNKTTGATDLVAKSIIYLSENIQTLATLMLAAGAGAAARYATQFGLVTVAKMKDAMATRASIAEELRLAQANLAAAQAEVKRTAAIVAKGGAHAKNTIALNNETVATARLAAAQQAAAATTRSFLALLGGPAGIVGLLTVGVTAFSMFANAAKDTGEALKELKDPIDVLLDRFEKLNAEQKKLALIKYDEARVEMLKKEARAAEDVYGYLVKMNTARYKEAQGRDIAIYKMHEYKQAIDEAINSGGDIIDTIEKIAKETNMSTADTKAFIEAASGYTGARDLVAQMAEKLGILSKAADDAKVAVEGLTAAQREQAAVNDAATKEIDSYTQSLKNSFNTMQDGGSEVKKLNRIYDEQAKKNAVLTEEQQKQKEENLRLAKAIDDERESRKTSNKEIQVSNNVLKDLQNELYLATLSGKELAIARAEQRLNEFATQQEVQAVRDLAGALYDLNEAKKFGKDKEEQDKYIEGDVGNLAGGQFDQQIERYMREAELEQEKYEEQLERLREARELQLQTNEEFDDLEYALKQKHDQRMGRIAKATTQVTMQAYSNAFEAIGDVMKSSQGEQSKAYKAMFAMAKAFSLAQTLLALPTAIAEAMKLPWPANLAAAAMAGATVASQIAAVGAVTFGGGRQYGGGVVDDKMYQVNETGQPEIFNAAGGKQYFLPNTRGEVIPADKAFGQSQGGGASKVTVNLIEDSSRGGTIEDQSTNEETILNVFVADIRSGGAASQTFEATYGLTRQGL